LSLEWVQQSQMITQFPRRRTPADDGWVQLPPEDWEEVAILPTPGDPRQPWYYAVYQDSYGQLWAAAWTDCLQDGRGHEVAAGCWRLDG